MARTREKARAKSVARAWEAARAKGVTRAKAEAAAERARAGRPTTWRALSLLLAAVLVLLGLGGYGVVAQLDDLRYTTAQAGTPGHYTVGHCEYVLRKGETKSALVCRGVFRSDDNLTTDPTITIGYQEPDGARLPMQYDSQGQVHQVGTAAVVGNLAALWGCALPLILGVWTARAFFRAVGRRRESGISEAFAATAPGAVGKWSAVAAVGLFVVSIGIYLVARLVSPVY